MIQLEAVDTWFTTVQGLIAVQTPPMVINTSGREAPSLFFHNQNLGTRPTLSSPRQEECFSME